MNTSNAKLVAPPAIEQVIAGFDRSDKPLDEHVVKQALKAARETLTNPSEDENLGAWAEILAFALVSTRHHSGPWKTYFGPMSSWVQDDGTTVYSPGIDGTDAQVFDHWTQRARTITHPVLKARYADLAWDMSRAIAKRNPDPAMARIAIDAYLASLASNLGGDVHHRFEAALRALDLAVMISDIPRIDLARTALLGLHRDALGAGRGLWWIAVDRLLDDKRAGVTDAERDQLVADLEAIVALRSNTADPKLFDPHTTEDAARRLIKFYTARKRGTDARRLHERVGKTSEHFASLASPMLASSVLQTAVNAYRDAGMADESRRVRVAMEEKIAASRGEMKSFSFESTISRDDMEQFLRSVVVEDLGGMFVRIASEFLQRRSALKKQVDELLEKAPLMAMITQTVMADDHVAAKIGSVMDDPIGRLVQEAAQGISLSDVWLVTALASAIEIHSVRPGHFVSWTARSGLFEDLTLLAEGVTAWYAQDYVKALHVLVPQIEVALRNLAAKLGKPTTKAHPAIPGASVAINMGDMLHAPAIIDALGPDTTLHLQTLYTDPRGFNLRNDLAHGLLAADRMSLTVASRVLHTLLVLGIWRELAESRRKGADSAQGPG
jgi:lysyl-tRNA synthetase class 1